MYPLSAARQSLSRVAMSYFADVQQAHQRGEAYRVAVDMDNLHPDISAKSFAEAVMFELLLPWGGDARHDIFWDVRQRDFVNGETLDAIAIMDPLAIDSAVKGRRSLSREEAAVYASLIVERCSQMAIETIVYYCRTRRAQRWCDIVQARHGGGAVDYLHLSEASKDVYREVIADRRPVSDLLGIAEAPTTAQRVEIVDRSVVYSA